MVVVVGEHDPAEEERHDTRQLDRLRERVRAVGEEEEDAHLVLGEAGAWRVCSCMQ